MTALVQICLIMKESPLGLNKFFQSMILVNLLFISVANVSFSETKKIDSDEESTLATETDEEYTCAMSLDAVKRSQNPDIELFVEDLNSKLTDYIEKRGLSSSGLWTLYLIYTRAHLGAYIAAGDASYYGVKNVADYWKWREINLDPFSVPYYQAYDLAGNSMLLDAKNSFCMLIMGVSFSVARWYGLVSLSENLDVILDESLKAFHGENPEEFSLELVEKIKSSSKDEIMRKCFSSFAELIYETFDAKYNL